MMGFEDLPILEPLSPAADNSNDKDPPSPDVLKYGSSSRYMSHKVVSRIFFYLKLNWIVDILCIVTTVNNNCGSNTVLSIEWVDSGNYHFLDYGVCSNCFNAISILSG